MKLSVNRGDGFVEMSLPEFFALPLVDRIRVILRHQIRFYDEASNPIPLAEGLKLLRDATPAHLRT
jgi:predicted PP-loop superfamily ATPase